MTSTIRTTGSVPPGPPSNSETFHPVDIAGTMHSLQFLLTQFQQADKLREEIDTLEQEITRVRQHIVIWADALANVDINLTPGLAVAVEAMLAHLTETILRRFHTTLVTEPINVEAEAKDVIRF